MIDFARVYKPAMKPISGAGEGKTKMSRFSMWVVVAMGILLAVAGADAKMIRIGEAQIVSHPALDNDAKGFKAALAEEGFIEGETVTFDPQNAQGEQPNCFIIARKFEDDKVDLIHAISTPVAQAQVKISKKIPIVFSSVTFTNSPASTNVDRRTVSMKSSATSNSMQSALPPSSSPPQAPRARNSEAGMSISGCRMPTT